MRLEARLGVKLLHRTTRRVSLTREGEAYLASCLQAIRVLEDTESSFASEKQSPSGRVRIDLPSAFGRRHVLPILLDLAGSHPQLDLSVTFNERKVDLVQANIDLVVRIGALEDQADSHGNVTRGAADLAGCSGVLAITDGPRISAVGLSDVCIIVAGGEVLVKAQVPLSELTDYAAELKGATAGRGRYDLEFSHYEPVPPQVQKQLVESWRPHHDED